MKQFTFNDTDRMKDIVTAIKPENIGKEKKEKIVDMLEELGELIELHPRNGLNFCMGGGMQVIVDVMIDNPDAEIRRTACVSFSQLTQNNMEVQQFALRSGALRLMQQFVKEEPLKAKEAVIGALSAFLRGDNFNSKREFIEKYGGLKFLSAIIMDDQNEQTTYRLIKKVLFLAYDFCLNDDSIFGE